MVISSGKDIHQGVPLVEHIMHGFMLLRLRQKAAVGCHAVKLLLYDMHDWYCVLLSPFVVVAFRPAVFSDLMLVVLVVKEGDKAYDNLGIEIVPVSVSAMLVDTLQKNIAQTFILERYFFFPFVRQ